MKAKLNKIGVFCGSGNGLHPKYGEVAREFGAELAKRNLSLVFGGANVGLMGQIADEVLKHGGEVIGVIPAFLTKREIAHSGVTHLHVVDSMHERKNLITKLSDGFVMLPGGVGSLDEFFEILTLIKIGVLEKPCAILNVDHYYDDLIRFVEKSVQEKFYEGFNWEKVIVKNCVGELLDELIEEKASVEFIPAS